MSRNKPVLDPYCIRCGGYKGVGPCRSNQCEGIESPHAFGWHSPPTNDLCALCNEAAEIVCSRCGRGYCVNHSSFRTMIEMNGLEHHIGTCSTCSELVCEKCWILDANGMIMCIEHMEENPRIDTGNT